MLSEELLELELCSNRESANSKLLIKDAFRPLRNLTTPEKQKNPKDLVLVI